MEEPGSGLLRLEGYYSERVRSYKSFTPSNEISEHPSFLKVLTRQLSALNMPISHVMVQPSASQHAAAVEFYTKALQPLGYSKLKSFPGGLTGFGKDSPDWWVAINKKDTQSTFHVAFRAPGNASISKDSLRIRILLGLMFSLPLE